MTRRLLSLKDLYSYTLAIESILSSMFFTVEDIARVEIPSLAASPQSTWAPAPLSQI